MGQRVTEGRSCALHSQPAAGWPTAARCRAAGNSPPLLLCACAALSRQWRERSRPIPRPHLTAHAVECGLGAEPGATPREHGHDRDRERQAHANTVTAHDHGRGSRMCDPCLTGTRVPNRDVNISMKRIADSCRLSCRELGGWVSAHIHELVPPSLSVPRFFGGNPRTL
jgi:hypothetical protein